MVSRGDQIAGLPLRDTGSAGVNDADDIVAGRIGQWRDAGIQSAAHQHVGEGNSAGQNPDAQLIRARIANVVFDYFEDFRSTESGEDDAGVSHFDQFRPQMAKIFAIFCGSFARAPRDRLCAGVPSPFRVIEYVMIRVYSDFI